MADIRPAVVTLPLATLPLTVSAVNVPTDVMLACAAVVTVPAVVADAAEVANVALATVPVTLAPAMALSPEPLPANTAPVMLPVAEIRPAVRRFPVSMLPTTDNEVRVPTEVAVIPVSRLPLPIK